MGILSPFSMYLFRGGEGMEVGAEGSPEFQADSPLSTEPEAGLELRTPRS